MPFRYSRWVWRCRVAMAAALLGPSALACWAADAPLPAAAPQAERQALLDSLTAPGCRFQRNGRWYTGPEARDHLARKWQEMERRQQAQSTEQFIERGASASMMSGQPYQVQCSADPAQPSRDWLLAQLRALRQARP